MELGGLEHLGDQKWIVEGILGAGRRQRLDESAGLDLILDRLTAIITG